MSASIRGRYAHDSFIFWRCYWFSRPTALFVWQSIRPIPRNTEQGRIQSSNTTRFCKHWTCISGDWRISYPHIRATLNSYKRGHISRSLEWRRPGSAPDRCVTLFHDGKRLTEACDRIGCLWRSAAHPHRPRLEVLASKLPNCGFSLVSHPYVIWIVNRMKYCKWSIIVVGLVTCQELT